MRQHKSGIHFAQQGRRLLIAGLLLATACEDPNLPPQAPVGEMSATLGGAISEQYEVKGSYPGPHTGQPVTFAAVRPGVEAGTFSIGGWRARDPQIQDVLLVDLRGVAEPGAYPIAGGFLTYGQTATAPGRIFRITSGEVTIHIASGDHLEGTFHATAAEVVLPLGGPAPDTVHIADGAFDVPVVIP